MAISNNTQTREFDKFGGTDRDNTFVKTSVNDQSSGLSAEVIPTNGYNGLVTMTPGHISTSNSTNTPLLAGETFTGEWEDITNFGNMNIIIFTDQISAVDGLCIEKSTDGINPIGTDCPDEYTIPANTTKTFSLQCDAKYFRVKYTNGAVDQTTFKLQTTLKPYYVKPSSHRIQDMITTDDDAELVKAVIT